MEKLNSLILLRGLPGSGKTTLAQVISENGLYPIYSIDDFFTDSISGEYQFVFKDNHLAYKHCEQQTQKAMEEDVTKIVLHNTFTMDWEIEPYFKMAKVFNYRVFVMTVENYHGQSNCHHISDEQLFKMAQKYKIKLY